MLFLGWKLLADRNFKVTFYLSIRLTGDPKHLYRATKFADFLDTDTFKNGARQPDCPLSLYEGWAGTLCFLLDLSRPDQAHFPFSDVFYHSQ